MGRVGGSEAEGQFKTVKKNFSFSDNKKDSNLRNSHLLMKRGASEEHELEKEKKSLLGYGYLLEQKKVNELKEHINFMAQ